ncbi:RING finger protein 168, e3 ubiquitin protein ligase [Plakobranchus ocellatus]|uniref:RING-type E3 ubiquitin transferase n=1 Tax=Plakobranchus ocellatus TaxID=259542 RepID=A0AAV4CGS5_9GAST|nr:RING finger protein 168, e3 ubiquitin protein ligase [Plakobranchus ocellatus]
MEATKTGPDKESCTCPICMYIMVEPVTMPCKHTLCMYCYTQTVAQSSLVCPICRQRISVWARRAAKTNALVDQEKWRAIQTSFPKKVQRRIEMMEGASERKEEEDDSDSDDQDCVTYLRKLKELSKPGEIRQEYDDAMKKLQQQRELEAKKEEEASAALIRALQEEEAQEVERLRREREEMERLGLAVAEQLQEASFDKLNNRSLLSSPQAIASANKPQIRPTVSKKLAKNKKDVKKQRPTSTLDGKMNTLNNFFSPVPRTPSAPSLSSQFAALERQKNRQLSPYPYPCISPKDKIFYGLSALGGLATSTPRPRSNSSSSEEAPGLREEHSYSTASAKVVDLTNNAIVDALCGERTDIVTYDLSKVKSEPEDIFGPGPSGLNKFSQQNFASSTSSAQSSVAYQQEILPPTVGNFQPIVAYQRTPPKLLPNGAADEVPITHTVAKRLILGKPIPRPSSASSNPSSEDGKSSPKMKSATGVGKTSAAALRKKKAEEALKNSAAIVEDQEDLKSEHNIHQIPASKKCKPATIFISENVRFTYDSRPKVPCLQKGPKLSFACNRLSAFTEEKLDCTVSIADESDRSDLTNCSIASNRSDQENNSSGREARLVSSHSTGFTPAIAEQPLKVSSSTNSAQVHKIHSSAPGSLPSDTDSREKEEAWSLKHKSLNNTQTKSTQEKKIPVQRSDSKAKSFSNKSKPKPRGKAVPKTTLATLDSFVQGKKRPFSCLSSEETSNSDMTQEEKDHIFALQLQEMYQELDRKHIKVDRFKGSVNEYSLRKKRNVQKF